MLVQGTARRLHALRSSAVLVKLDISKAFDTIQWPFLLEVLEQMGFGPRWIAWICGILSTSTTKIAVNGVPGTTIYNCCGLRQGDPISQMLFILCMEPLQHMFKKAEASRILTPLARSGLKQRLSMFADDVTLFIKSTSQNLTVCTSILSIFGQASGLRVNMVKTTAIPIRSSQEEMDLVCTTLGCSSASFPCKYLGLPLSIRKQTATQFQGLVEQLATRLPHWKAATLPKSSRALLMQSVLSAIPIHTMLAMELPPKTISALIKICRGFLWCGKAEAGGGACMVAWERVCRPKWAGGLGILDIKWMNVALQARWLWLQRTDRYMPWAEFAFSVPKESKCLFQAATRAEVEDGRETLFWEDRWLDGHRLQELAPRAYKHIPARTRHSRIVYEAIVEERWARDIGPSLDVEALDQYMRIWPRIAAIQLDDQRRDRITWFWEQDGQYSAKSAYAAKFPGLEVSPIAAFTWRSKTTLRCRFFAWLAIMNGC